MNLVLNALQATSKGGSVWLNARAEECDPDLEKERRSLRKVPAGWWSARARSVGEVSR